MPDRFRKFNETELDALLRSTRKLLDFTSPVDRPLVDDLDRLKDEIEHEQIQRKHAAARQMVPA